MLLMNLSDLSLSKSRFSRLTLSATSYVTLVLMAVRSSLHLSIIELNLGKK